MATVAAIKAAIKTILDATGQLGSVYTEDRERIEKPQPAAVTMWHAGGAADPESNTRIMVTTRLLLRLLVPRPPARGDAAMQQTCDAKLETIRDELRKKPTLDTGSGPLVLSCFPVSWEVDYDPENKRMDVEIQVSVTYEEG